nr:hypothetical protein [Tanacetum cinerariifolium]
AVKKTSFPEMGSSGSIVVNIPEIVEGEEIRDSSRKATSISILEEQSK